MALIEKMTGHKATDKDMQCRGFQYELGKWYECEGDLAMCDNGFHFCPQPSGVWNYYNSEGTRVFKVEAEGVIDLREPGTDNKCVARRIRLIEEVKIGGSMNTGDMNTGDMNTGDMNTGSRNTGSMNTGDRNTGSRNAGSMNTGYMNAGDMNTGSRNTGSRNTGDMNAGDMNTGSRNTGSMNTGSRNTGSRNTGQGNACDFSTGNFCTKTCFLVFDKPCRITREKYYEKFGELHCRLCELLSSDVKFDPEEFKALPNWSRKAVLKLHRTHIARRKAMVKK